MELPYQLEKALVVQLRNISFNPCFNGIAISTPFIHYSIVTFTRVSILVLMELPYQHIPEKDAKFLIAMFQSLF